MLPFSALRKPAPAGGSRRNEILVAAGRTAYYASRKIDDFAAISPVPLDFVSKHPGLFRNPAAKLTPAEFQHPHSPEPLTIVLEGGFRATPNVRVAASGWEPAFESFRPGSIAAATHRLVSLAQGPSHPRPSHSLIAFVGPKFGVLASEDRDLLWTSFGIPVYEQFRGLGGELLASECDAHDGLHIREQAAVFEEGDELVYTSLLHLAEPVIRLATGMCARIERRVCGCGEVTPRLMDLERPSKHHLLNGATLTAQRSASAGC